MNFSKTALTVATLGFCGSLAAESICDNDTPWKVLPIYGGGYVQNVCIADSNPQRWYNYVDVGGPYRSDDAGKTWYPIHANFTVSQRQRCADHVRTMLIDPRDEDSLVIAGGNNFWNPAGIFVSRDGGKTFRQTLLAHFQGNGSCRMYGQVLARNPSNPDELICGEDMDGLFRSRDNGETWKPLGLDGHIFTDVRYDVTKNGRIWATSPELTASSIKRLGGPSTRKAGLWRSDDGGDNWQKVLDDAPVELCQIAGETSIVATWGYCGAGKRLKPVKISDDGGMSWRDYAQGLVAYNPETMTNGHLNCGTYYAMAAGPDFMLIGDSMGNIYRRSPKDEKWKGIAVKPRKLGCPDRETHVAHHSGRMEALGSIIIDRRDASHWLATDWYFVWETHDAGTNWTSRIKGMMQLVSSCIDFDPFDREKIRYGVADMAYFCSTNGGVSYFRPKAPVPYAKSISHSLKTPGLVLAGGGKEKCALYWSQDGGVTWRYTQSKSGIPRLITPNAGVFSVAIDPVNDDFYVVVSGPIKPMGGGVYRSHDRGVNWEWFSEGLPLGKSLFKGTEWGGGMCSQLKFSPDGSALLASEMTHSLYRLDREGGKWEKASVGYTSQEPVADPHTPGRFILPSYVMLETLDGGKTFHNCWSMPSSAWMVAFDARIKGLVVFGNVDGLYVSHDGGIHSAPLHDGLRLPSGGSRRVAIDDGRLFFMTSGSGVFTRNIK